MLGGVRELKVTDPKTVSDQANFNTPKLTTTSNEASTRMSNHFDDSVVPKKETELKIKSPTSLLKCNGLAEKGVPRFEMMLEVTTSQIAPPTVVQMCPNVYSLLEFVKLAKKQQVIAFALATCDVEMEASERIGLRVLGRKGRSSVTNAVQFTNGQKALMGLAVTWHAEVFYLDLIQTGYEGVCMFRKLVQSPAVTLCGFELKQQLVTLYNCCQLEVTCATCDPAVADWLLAPLDKHKTLKQMMKQYLPKVRPRLSAKDSALDHVLSATTEATQVWQLCNKLLKKLAHVQLETVFMNIEMPTQLVLTHMELTGMGFDRPTADLLWGRVETKMVDIQQHVFLLAGRKFNLWSRADLAKVKQMLRKKGDHENLERIINLFERWRQLNSLKTRNLSGLLVGHGTAEQTNTRVFTRSVTRSVTGRISTHEPNLQNIPRDLVFDDGVFSLRSAFTPVAGNVVVSADFCQLELRLLAHLSQDAMLIAAFQTQKDVFVSIAATWNGISESEVTEDLRHRSKQLCYGIIYGMGAVALAEAMSVSEPVAGALAESFRQTYPGLQKYQRLCIDRCITNGYVTTLLGRRRYLHNIASRNTAIRRQSERQAFNTTVQGSAADVAKTAMVRIEQALVKALPQRQFLVTQHCAAHLVLHMHDELVYEVSKDLVELVCSIIRSEMEGAIKLSVPLLVKMRIGPSWGQLTEML